MIGGGHILRGRAADGEDLIVHRAHTEREFPVCGASREIERAGHQNEPCSHERHGAKLLDKTDIKADGDADLSPRGIEDGKVIAGREGIGLHEALAAGNVDIEQMHLAVLCDLLPLG